MQQIYLAKGFFCFGPNGLGPLHFPSLKANNASMKHQHGWRHWKKIVAPNDFNLCNISPTPKLLCSALPLFFFSLSIVLQLWANISLFKVFKVFDMPYISVSWFSFTSVEVRILFPKSLLPCCHQENMAAVASENPLLGDKTDKCWSFWVCLNFWD